MKYRFFLNPGRKVEISLPPPSSVPMISFRPIFGRSKKEEIPLFSSAGEGRNGSGGRMESVTNEGETRKEEKHCQPSPKISSLNNVSLPFPLPKWVFHLFLPKLIIWTFHAEKKASSAPGWRPHKEFREREGEKIPRPTKTFVWKTQRYTMLELRHAEDEGEKVGSSLLPKPGENKSRSRPKCGFPERPNYFRKKMVAERRRKRGRREKI